MKNPLAHKLRELAAAVTGPLPKKLLGKTGIQATILGLGGGNIISFPEHRDEAVGIVREALSLGINYYDTGIMYGSSEEHMGEALEGSRKGIYLATKTRERTRDGAWRELEKSLKNLRTDYLDVWFLHRIDHENEVKQISADDGAVKALQEAKEQGVVRHTGVSGHYDPSALVKALKAYQFDVVLMPVNAADVHGPYSFIKKALPKAVEAGMGVIGMKVACLGRIFHAWGVRTMEQALNYSLSQPIDLAIVGVDEMRELHENVLLAKAFRPMSGKDMTELEDKTKQYAELACFFKKGNEKHNPFWGHYPQEK